MNKTYKCWFELLESSLDDLTASMDNEEIFFIQEDRQKLLEVYQDFTKIKDTLIPEATLVSDLNNILEEIIFYLNLASDDIKQSIKIV